MDRYRLSTFNCQVVVIIAIVFLSGCLPIGDSSNSVNPIALLVEPDNGKYTFLNRDKEITRIKNNLREMRQSGLKPGEPFADEIGSGLSVKSGVQQTQDENAGVRLKWRTVNSTSFISKTEAKGKAPSELAVLQKPEPETQSTHGLAWQE